MLYSAGQLIGKTILMNKTVPVYSVLSINESGDNAKPVADIERGNTFVLDSFLAPTSGYTSIYGIKYAPRKYPYFTYYDGSNYNAVMVVGDGRFSLDALKQQGALSVKEEITLAAAQEKEATDPIGAFFDKMGFGGISKWIKPILIIVIILVLFPLIVGAVGSAKSLTAKK